MHPEFDEMVEGNGQSAIVIPAVVGMFDFNSVKDETSGSAEHRPAWCFHHLDGTR
jgi:hypothetical protein